MTYEQATARLVALARSSGGTVSAAQVEADDQLAAERELVSAAARALAGGTNVFSATVPTQANQMYILQYKSTANEPSWTGLAPVQGTGQSVRLTDSTGTNLHRIYRVHRL